ncbi:MAG: response regulator transcription factor [Acidobacteria bacterium]|nr:response regulator transcription factor [Acidobacteriota bacterium]
MTQTIEKSLSQTNVFIVAENRLLRESLARLLRKRSDLCVVGEGSYSDATPATIAATQSHLVLLDYLTAGNGSDLICNLRESAQQVRLVLFGMDDDAGIFLQAVRLGVSGYLLKNASASELVDALRSVAQGEAVCPLKFCKILFQALAGETGQRTAIAEPRVDARFELTQRQRQLMSLVAMGLSNKEIAANLNLSEFTVKNHIYRVMKQVDAQNRHEACHLIRAGESHVDQWQSLSFR